MVPRVCLFACLLLAACFRPTSESTDGGSTPGTDSGITGPLGARLAITPSSAIIPTGSALTFSAHRVLDDGTVADVSASVAWSIEGPVTLTGRTVRASSPGTARLHAKLNDESAVSAITIPAATLTALAISPGFLALGAGASEQLTVTGELSDGTALDLTAQAVFASSAPEVGVGAGGLVRALAPGTATISATVGTAKATILVTVTLASVTSIAVQPAALQLAPGTKVQLTAVGTFDDGTTGNLTLAATWTANGNAATVSPSGLVTAAVPGLAEVSASFDGRLATAAVTVTTASLTGLALEPKTATLGPGERVQLTATGSYSDGSRADLTQAVSFLSNDPAIAAVSNGTRGLVTGLSAGAATITARLGNTTASTAITVNPATLTGLMVTPAAARVAIQSTAVFVAKGSYSDGTMRDVSASAVWTSSAPGLLAVSGAKATGLAAGQAQVRAMVGGQTASAQVTVPPKRMIAAIFLTPVDSPVPPGKTIFVKAMARYDDGSAADVSAQAMWTSSVPSVASVSNAPPTQGFVTAVTAGVTEIEAKALGFTATMPVTVAAPVIIGMSTFPQAHLLIAGLAQYCEAYAAYSDGTVERLYPQVTWTTSNPTAVTLMQIPSSNYYTYAPGPLGTSTITATHPNGMKAGFDVEVVAGVSAATRIIPAQATVPVGTVLPMTSIVEFSNGRTQPWGGGVWTSSNPAVAAVAPMNSLSIAYTREVTALAPGTATITDTGFGGVLGTTVLTVTDATLSRIQVTPFSPKLPAASSVQLKATGIYSDNTARDISSVASWSTGAHQTASITGNGTQVVSAQLLQPGTVTITAYHQGVVGTTVVEIGSNPPVSVEVTPASSTLPVNGSKVLNATATFADGSTRDVTLQVAWSSSAANVADVLMHFPYDGLVTGRSPGTATITARYYGIAASAQVVVQ